MTKRRRGYDRSPPARRRPERDPRTRGRRFPLVAVGLIGALVVGVVALVLVADPFASGRPGASATGGTGGGGCPTSQPDPLPAGERRVVTIATDLGTIEIVVDAALSPIAAGNFVALATCGYYDGVVFHRTATLPDGTPFVIQGGDPTGTGSGGPGYTIADEPVTGTYARGTVAMARTRQPNSVGSQFFIVLHDGARPALESANTYQIIGTVSAGMEVADSILAASGGQELPADPVTMTDVSVANPSPAEESP